MKKRNILILAIAAVVIIAAGIVTAVVAKSGHVNIEEQLSLGERYLTEGDYEKAVLAFTKVIDADPMNADAYMGRAKAYAVLGQLENGRADFDQCLIIDGDHLADRYLEYGKWLESIDLLEEAQKIFVEGYAQTGDERLLAEINDRFMADYTFVPFEEIPEAEQGLILLLVQELTQGKGLGELTESVAYLKTMALPENDIQIEIRTIYENRKIEYLRYVPDDNSDLSNVRFEMREENGSAYSYSYGASLMEDGYDVYDGEEESIYRASTVNWQVNGEVSCEMGFNVSGNYTAPEYKWLDTLSGQAKENVRIGIWTYGGWTVIEGVEEPDSLFHFYDDTGHYLGTGFTEEGPENDLYEEDYIENWCDKASANAEDFRW